MWLLSGIYCRPRKMPGVLDNFFPENVSFWAKTRTFKFQACTSANSELQLKLVVAQLISGCAHYAHKRMLAVCPLSLGPSVSTLFIPETPSPLRPLDSFPQIWARFALSFSLRESLRFDPFLVRIRFRRWKSRNFDQNSSIFGIFSGIHSISY